MTTDNISAADSSSISLRLPASVAAAVEDMHMPLGVGSYSPMHYKPLSEMLEIRRANPNNVVSSPLAADVVGTIALIRTDAFAHDSVQEYLARCAVGLLLLGHGATDEAHDLVSPLSWPNELPFAYGPPVAVPEHVLTLASYVHALVHRREGPNASEFNMTGFVNADYWAGSALRSPEGAEALPLEEIRSSMIQLATTASSSGSSSPVVQQWVQQNVEADQDAFPVWDPRVLNELCCQLQQAQSGATTTTTNNNNWSPQDLPAMQAFAEQAFLSEMKILLKHTLRKIGYNV